MAGESVRHSPADASQFAGGHRRNDLRDVATDRGHFYRARDTERTGRHLCRTGPPGAGGAASKVCVPAWALRLALGRRMGSLRCWHFCCPGGAHERFLAGDLPFSSGPDGCGRCWPYRYWVRGGACAAILAMLADHVDAAAAPAGAVVARGPAPAWSQPSLSVLRWPDPGIGRPQLASMDQIGRYGEPQRPLVVGAATCPAASPRRTMPPIAPDARCGRSWRACWMPVAGAVSALLVVNQCGRCVPSVAR